MHPIIYVRGFAATESEIEETTSTPYMGFNLGSTKIRQRWDKKTERHIFESPLIRLIKEYGYRDAYEYGTDELDSLPRKSVIIYRYYDQADKAFGPGETPSIEKAAQGLHELILKTRDRVVASAGIDPKEFKVYLVAHSMGGLICRAFLQNPGIGTEESKAMVDKVFTYATPHNGIDFVGVNVPTWLGINDVNNFARPNMARYLGLPPHSKNVNVLNGAFPEERFFCLVGTNHRDYAAAGGIARKLAGEMSDGLVRIKNATVEKSPRAFVHRSHSGFYGIVNSESGHQNLVRFLFGDLRVIGTLNVKRLPLPNSVAEAKQDKQIRASYYFECSLAPRGAMLYALTDRRKDHYSAILRTFDELFHPDRVQGLFSERHPVLFSAFLDSAKIAVGRTVVFAIDLSVSTTGYEIDGWLRDRDIPGETLFRDVIVIRATKGSHGWTLRYNLDSESWGETRGKKMALDGNKFVASLSSRKGFEADLKLDFTPWK